MQPLQTVSSKTSADAKPRTTTAGTHHRQLAITSVPARITNPARQTDWEHNSETSRTFDIHVPKKDARYLGLDTHSVELLEDRVRPRNMIASMMNNLGLDTHSVINAHLTCPKPKANSHRVLSAWFAGTRGNFADIPRSE